METRTKKMYQIPEIGRRSGSVLKNLPLPVGSLLQGKIGAEVVPLCLFA